MTTCAVIDANNQLINMIIAEPTDVAPDGCTLVEVPIGMYWNGTQVVSKPVVSEED